MKPKIVRTAETMNDSDLEDVTPTGDSAFVAKQVKEGVSLTDLDLPRPPKNHVFIWDEELPLNIRDHPLLSEYVFRWLYPKGRERGDMEGYQYVAGDLARAVRRCNIIPSLIGGDDSDEMIRSGDLILGWMPKSMAEARRIYFQKKSYAARAAVEEQSQSGESMKRGRGGRYINQYGEVTSHVGPLQE